MFDGWLDGWGGGLDRERYATQESRPRLEEQSEGTNGDDLSVSSAFQEGGNQHVRTPAVGIDDMSIIDNMSHFLAVLCPNMYATSLFRRGAINLDQAKTILV